MSLVLWWWGQEGRNVTQVGLVSGGDRQEGMLHRSGPLPLLLLGRPEAVGGEWSWVAGRHRQRQERSWE